MFLIQEEEWYTRAKEEAIADFISHSLYHICRERRKIEKKAPDEIRNWSLGKTKDWPRQKQIEYINQYKRLIKKYKNIPEYFTKKARLFHQYICLYEITKGVALIENHRIRFRVTLDSRRHVPDGEYFLYKKPGSGYKVNKFCVFSREKPKSFDSGTHTAGFFNFMGIAGRYSYYKIGRAVISRNKIIWLELRKCWEDDFVWLNNGSTP